MHQHAINLFPKLLSETTRDSQIDGIHVFWCQLSEVYDISLSIAKSLNLKGPTAAKTQSNTALLAHKICDLKSLHSVVLQYDMPYEGSTTHKMLKTAM